MPGWLRREIQGNLLLIISELTITRRVIILVLITPDIELKHPLMGLVGVGKLSTVGAHIAALQVDGVRRGSAIPL